MHRMPAFAEITLRLNPGAVHLAHLRLRFFILPDHPGQAYSMGGIPTVLYPPST
jgi:hypothetical protein